MEEHNKPSWKDLPEAIRSEWIREAAAFYIPGSVSDADIVEMAQENYNVSDTMHPSAMQQETTN